MKITVGISNRHVHLKEETYKYLFDKCELEKRNDLNQIGEFASTDTVSIIYNEKKIEHVRIVGPFRKQNQVELLKSDLEFLNLDAPTRRSGDLENTPRVIISANGKEIETDGVIRAERHVHVPTSKTEELNLHERDVVKLFNDKISFFANVKVSDKAYFEVHIDKDEAAEFNLQNGEELTITLCGK